jgi:peptide/nickel transport system permease protein
MTEPAAKTPRSRGRWRETWRYFRRSKGGAIGLVFLGAFLLVGLLAPALANKQPVMCRYDGKWHFPAVVDCVKNIPLVGGLIEKDRPFRFPSFNFKRKFEPDRDWALSTLVPYGPLESSDEIHEPPSREHWLGTDSSGRDVLARLIHGTSVSMKIGIISMGIAAILGLCIGAFAGYFGGWVDIVLSRVIEVVICFPVFFLVLAVLAWFPPRIENVMIVIGLTRWVSIARLTRGEFLRLREVEYSVAARALGASSLRVIFRHLLPNSLAPALVQITFGVATAILVESGLSWLGFGVQPPFPSWGNVLRDGYEIRRTSAHIIPPACAAIFVSVLCFNLLGDALRDAIDPRTRSRSGDASLPGDSRTS